MTCVLPLVQEISVLVLLVQEISVFCTRTDEVPQAEANMQPGPASMDTNFPSWCGNNSSLVSKYFVSCVEIFRLQCEHYYNRNKKCPHQRERNVYARDNKFSHQSQNISTKEQISKENILNVGCENILFQKSKIKRELFVLITIILLPYQLRNLSKLNVSKRQSKNVLCPILNLFNFRKSRHNRSKDDKIPQT